MAWTLRHPQTHLPARPVEPYDALRIAWYLWLTLLAIPFFAFLYAIWQVMFVNHTTPANQPLVQRWLLAMVLYTVILVPAALFLRSKCYRAYYTGKPVSSRRYLAGALIIWLTLEIGILLSLVGCLITNSLLPNFLPALVHFMVFVTQWPTGRAMASTANGNSDDPEKYEEPR